MDWPRHLVIILDHGLNRRLIKQLCNDHRQNSACHFVTDVNTAQLQQVNNGPLLSKVTYPTHFLAAADSRSSFVPPARRLIHRLHSHQAKHRHLVLYFSFQVVSLAIISFVIIPFDGSYSFHALVYPLVHKEVHFLPQTPTCNQKITCLNVLNGASCNHIAIETLFIVKSTLAA